MPKNTKVICVYCKEEIKHPKKCQTAHLVCRNKFNILKKNKPDLDEPWYKIFPRMIKSNNGD